MGFTANERQVMLLNLSVTMVPIEAQPVWSPAKFFEAVKLIYEAGQAFMVVGDKVGDDETEDNEELEELADGASILRIADLRVGTDGTMTLLFHHGDGKASEPRFMDRRTTAIRASGMQAHESLSHAAHLVIALPAGPSKSISVKAVLERAPSLGRSTIINFLNRLVRLTAKASDYRFTAEDGKKLRYHPKLAVSMPLSANMKADLQESRLSRIEFVKSEEVASGLDEDGIVHPTMLRLVHEVNGKLDKKQNLGLYLRAKAQAKASGFDNIQVRYTRPGTTNTLSPTFSTEQEDAEDALYARSFPLTGFVEKLSPCPTEIVDEVLTKMHAMVGNAKLWK